MEQNPTTCQLFGTVLILLISELILVSTHWQPILLDLAPFKIEESKLESHSFWFVHAPTIFMTCVFYASIMQGWLKLPNVFAPFEANNFVFVAATPATMLYFFLKSAYLILQGSLLVWIEWLNDFDPTLRV